MKIRAVPGLKCLATLVLVPPWSVGFVFQRDNNPAVPEGPNDRSQPRKLSGLESVQKGIRPVGTV
jgi:hypothetical protein